MTPDFHAVWNRVVGNEEIISESDLLQELISRKTKDIAVYHALKRKTGFMYFNQLEHEEREQCLALQTHYYLLTGDSAVCRPEVPEIPHGILRALRNCYRQEFENSELLKQYSNRFSTDALRTLCRTQANREAEHAALIWNMAKRFL